MTASFASVDELTAERGLVRAKLVLHGGRQRWLTGHMAVAVASYDVFLSYNGRDREAVERLAERLVRSGLHPWFDRWCLTAGEKWSHELAAGLGASSACAVFIGPDDVGDWEREELAVALDRAARERSFRLFLVLLPGLPEPFDAGMLSPFLSTRTWVDFRRGFGDAQALQALVNAIKGVPLGPPGGGARADEAPPYRGLESFHEEHAELFFGRDREVQRLLEKLKASSLLAVVGPSGSGKSSLARAGLVPALRRGALPGAERLRIVTLRPGAHPLDVLAAELAGLVPELAASRARDELAADPRTLRLRTARQPADTSGVLFLVDQCEEVFTLCRDEDQRRAFLLNLVHAAAADGPCVVVLTLRADFYPRCSAYPELAQLIASHQFLVSPLDEDGLRQAIEEPAHLAGFELEAGLVETILEDVEHQPGALPLLEHALLELWRRRRGRMLTLEAYRDSGGVTGALAKRADAIFASFDTGQREIVRRVLLRLTQPGEGAEDTRRRAPLRELVTLPDEPGAIEAVVRSLADARLLTTGGDDIEVAHEALIRGWPRLRHWVEEDRQGLRIHRRLTEAAEEWRALERDPGALYRGARLGTTREWAADHEADLNVLERQFLAASAAAAEAEIEAARRRARRLRALAGALAILFVAAIVLALLAVRSRNEAKRQQRVTTAGALAGEAATQMERRPDLAMLLGLQALATGRTQAEARSAAVAAVERSDGIVALPPLDYAVVSGMALSPDGRTLAVSGGSFRANTITLWDARTWRRLGRPLAGHTNDVLELQFSPDGRMLASSSEDNTARLWQVPSGRPLGRSIASGHGTGVAFSPDGARLALGDDFGDIQVIDVATRKIVAESGSAGFFPIHQLVFYGDDRIASASRDAAIRLWTIRRTKVVRDRRCAPPSSTANRLAYAPGPGLLAWAGTDLGLLDPRSCTVVARRRRGGGDALAFDAAGRRLAVGDATGAHIWSVPDLTPLHGADRAPVYGVAFVGDGSRLITGGDPGGVLHVWDLSGAHSLARRFPTGGIPFALSPDGRMVAAVAHQHVALFDARTRGALGTLDARDPEVLAFSPDGRLLAVGSSNGKLSLWSLRSRQSIASVRADDTIDSMAFSVDGRELATSANSPRTRFWSVPDLHPTRPMLRVWAWAMHFLPGPRLLVCDEADATQLWDVHSGRTLPFPTLECGESTGSLAMTRDRSMLAAGTSGEITLWDMRGSRQLSKLFTSGHGTTGSLDFSPDGRTLVSADDDGSLRLWDVPAARQLGGELNGYSQVAFSPDGTRLLSSGKSGLALLDPLLWQNDVERLRRRICPVVAGNLDVATRQRLLGKAKPACAAG